MNETDGNLRHLPFFEGLASCEEGSSRWNVVTAGLVVLRLVDSWLRGPRPDAAADAWTVRSVRTAIDAIEPADPIRTILGRVVDSLEEQRPDVHVVVTPLMAYGQSLEYNAEWLLAVDVYHSVLGYLHPTADSDAVVAANLRLGQCYRNLGRLDEAGETFAEAFEVANAVGDLVGTLRARIGEARVAILHGNYPEADEILRHTIERAEGQAFDDVRSRALQDRSEIAHRRGDYALAVQLAYKALGWSRSAPERDRILNDIAVAFMSLGVYSAARDAYLVLSVTAQEQYVRWVAQLNLVELATDTGSEVLFEDYRRDLEGVALPPFIATAFEVAVGRGFHRFGRTESARARLERALILAEEHGLNAVYFRAEQLVVELANAPPPVSPSLDAPGDLREIANAIGEMRNAAGVG